MVMSFEDSKAYHVGRWFNPYVKVYTLGGDNRMIEVSNYPRAYMDTEPHIYNMDTLFIVEKEHLNEDKTNKYVDSKGNEFNLGETATHWKGDPLLGAFPKWITSESLPSDSNPVDNINDLPWLMVDLKEDKIWGSATRRIVRYRCRRKLRWTA